MFFSNKKKRLLFAKMRLEISRRINRLLLGETASRVPYNVFRSLEEASFQQSIKPHLAQAIEVSAPFIAYYDFPESYPAFFRRTKSYDKKSVYFLKDIFVSPHSGLVGTQTGFLFQESVGSLRRILGWGEILPELMIARRTLINENVYITCPPRPYFHWLLEVLPNFISALAIAPSAKILLPSNCPKYVLDGISLVIGPETMQNKAIVTDAVTQVKNYLMPQMDEFSGFVPPKHIQLLRDTIKAKVDLTSNPFNCPHIYISRKKAALRRLKNEEELENKLTQQGFKVIYAEEFKFEEQIALFSQAKFIIAPHGAGLSNIIWADERIKLLEIFPHNIFNDCYARLSMSLNYEYNYIFCHPDSESSGIIPVDLVSNMIEKVSVKC